MAIFTGDKLLASIKRGISLPFNQTRFTDDDLLDFADEELETTIMPVLLSMGQEFAVYEETVNIVTGQSKYQIPTRAAGRILRDLFLETAPNNTFQLPYIAPDDKEYYLNNGVDSEGSSGFYFENDKAVLIPTPRNNSFKLHMRYLMRHSQITKTSSARSVTNINTVTNELTLSSAFPAAVQAGTVIDLVKAYSQPVVISFDIPLVNVAGNVITLPSLPDDLVVGDWVSMANETPVLCLPDEVNQVLAQAVAVRVMEAQGDQQALQIAQANLDRKVKAMQTIMMPRIQNGTKVVIQRNGLLGPGRRYNIMRGLRV